MARASSRWHIIPPYVILMTLPNWYLIRMSYDNVIMSSGWHTLPFLSHPDEIVNFDFPHHAVALQRFRSSLGVLFVSGQGRSDRARFNIKLPSCHYRKPYCRDKTVERLSFLHNGISYTGKTSLYWIKALYSLPTSLYCCRYLKSVVDETFRCSRLAPYAARVQTEDSILGGYRIPANVL